jgi:two-component system, chemotaxis family, protein-glutamate methylesterase/glutaminase
LSRAIRVLVVDDSALMRTLITSVLEQAGMQVVGVAPDPFVAWEKIKSLTPDVLTLDVEMPGMNGISFLEKLMTLAPMPVVMVSAFAGGASDVTARALGLGAIDVIAKPRVDVTTGIVAMSGELVEKVRAAAASRVGLRPDAADRVIAIGSSTGGTEALREFLDAMPPDAPGVVIVQHMPERFTRPFAERLDRLCAVEVCEAKDGDLVVPGRVLIAPGDRHLRVRRTDDGYSVAVVYGAPVNRHRPSVDVLFRSCAAAAGKNAIGVIMTGMGHDGARGLLAMREHGARTFAQDPASCVVHGMPKAAIDCGAVEDILPLGELAAAVLRASVAPAR